MAGLTKSFWGCDLFKRTQKWMVEVEFNIKAVHLGTWSPGVRSLAREVRGFGHYFCGFSLLVKHGKTIPDLFPYSILETIQFGLHPRCRRTSVTALGFLSFLHLWNHSCKIYEPQALRFDRIQLPKDPKGTSFCFSGVFSAQEGVPYLSIVPANWTSFQTHKP
jgi:hypothetical protein